MPIWFWLNVPACTLIFLATAGIPLWLVLTHPDQRPYRIAARVQANAASSRPRDSSSSYVPASSARSPASTTAGRIKATVDPQNIIRANHPVPPAR
jgi:hypothetical protein